MATCKFISKEIAKRSVCQEVTTHLAECAHCSALYQEDIQLQEYLLGLEDVHAPNNLKFSILSRLQKGKRDKHLWPFLQTALRAVVLASIVFGGFWLGIETANDSSMGIDQKPETNPSAAYPLNTAPLDPSSLSEIYFKVVEGVKDE